MRNKNQTSKCRFFQDCGGCSYLDLGEEEYRNIKSQKLINNLKILGAVNPDFIWFDKNFRRKITLHFDEKNNLGFFQNKSKNLTKIDSCFVAEEKISNLIKYLQNFFNNFEQNLIIKLQITSFDNILDLIIFAKRDLNFAQINKLKDFAQNKKINISYKVKNKFDKIFEFQTPKIDLQNYINSSIKLDLESEIFLQASQNALKEIIQIIRNNIRQNSLKKIVDIYSGFGIYSFAIADLAQKIYALEGSEKMTNLTDKNIVKNSLKNKIIAKNRDLYNFPFSWQELKDFDLAIINPPRNGASPQIKEIAKSSIKNLIYVSCNYQTFIRDAKILLENSFVIKDLKALDQFHSTDHFEIVAVFVNG